MKIIVPSRGRAANVPTIQRLFPDCTWYVSKTEARAYRKANAGRIVEHPDDVLGRGKKVQWCLDHAGPDVFVIDDDIEYVWVNVGRLGRRIEDPKAIRDIIESTAICAREAGAKVFAFGQAWDVRKYRPNDPIALTGFVKAAIGFIGKLDITYDQGNMLRNDVPFSMNILARHRYFWRDGRFAFVNGMNTNTRGASPERTYERDIAECRKITAEWGKYVRFNEGNTRINVSVKVPRRQHIDFIE